MHVDFLTLAALRQDLEGLQNARIQQVLLTDPSSVALELYVGARTHLFFDVNPQHARAWLQSEKARRGVERETPLLLLLRKYVRGGRLRRVEQPPWERILRFTIESAAGRTTLVAEIMGRYSNLLLLDENGTVLECIRRTGTQRNSYRVTLPNHPYEPPPPLTKRVPTELSLEAWERLLAQANPSAMLHRFLVRELVAISPTLAREIAARATQQPNATIADVKAKRLHEVVHTLFAPLQSQQWEPHVALDEEGEVIAFAPYRLEQFAHVEPVASISEAMQRYFAVRLSRDAYAAARQRVEELLTQAQKSVKRRLHQLKKQVIDPSEVERLRENGELLLAYQWQVPKRAKEVELLDFVGTPRRLTLDPTLSAVQNAQKYFARYEKKKRAAREVPPRLKAAEQDATFLQQLANDLAQAEERPEIDAVRETLAKGGFIKQKTRRASGGVVRAPRRVLIGDWVALVGRNAAQNDEVTFRHAHNHDLWFHARGVPGAHVILKSAGRELPQDVIEHAASLAAYFSQARGSTRVEVTVTERRHVKRISGARPGLVTYRNESTLYVPPLTPDDVEEAYL